MTEDARDALDRAPESGSYKIDIDDTMSNIDAIMEEAMAVVDEEGEPNEESAAAESAAAEPEAAESAPEEKIDFETRDRLQRLQNESDTLRDRLARTAADFENFRRRSEREKENHHRYAAFNVLKDFLAVVDNLERAEAAAGSAEDLRTGVVMIVRQFQEVLGRHGVKSVAAVGEPFDPSVHEAVARHDSDEISVPTVTIEHQKGYQMHDRLLRPAMVQVAMPTGPKPAPAAESSAEESSTDNGGDADPQSMAESVDESSRSQEPVEAGG